MSKFQNKQCLNLYTCFVDFCKAFDILCENCSWRKLGKLRLNEKMRNTLETIYKHATGRVKGANGQLSDPIPTRNGAGQGCLLSPLLSLFISDIRKLLKEGGYTGPGVTLGTSQLPTVCYLTIVVNLAYRSMTKVTVFTNSVSSSHLY